ncbi:MAG: hypothetical protein Sapg2KO_25140 [Saprospiraceae bacterium]
MKTITQLFLLATLLACQSKPSAQSDYPRMIGDIAFDKEQDDPDFKLCSGDKRAIQYYALPEKPYAEEKPALKKHFLDQYDAEKTTRESGLIRIRFLVNCEGQAGRFRIMGMDWDYQEKTFDTSITDQLMSLTKSISKWKGFSSKSRGLDYYNYLIFKIEAGQLKEIMP